MFKNTFNLNMKMKQFMRTLSSDEAIEIEKSLPFSYAFRGTPYVDPNVSNHWADYHLREIANHAYRLSRHFDLDKYPKLQEFFKELTPVLEQIERDYKNERDITKREFQLKAPSIKWEVTRQKQAQLRGY